jgi:hypothetical protein
MATTNVFCANPQITRYLFPENLSYALERRHLSRYGTDGCVWLRSSVSVAQRRASRAMRMCCFFLPCVEKSVLFVGDGSLALIIYVALLYAVHVGNSVARGFAAA